MKYLVLFLSIIFINDIYASIIEKNDYLIYLPKNYVETKSYPLVFFCDPHGSGVYPINLYKDLADSFDYILVGSNISKNGVDINICETHIRNTIEEMFANYSIIKDNVSIVGFSGGSYIAYHMAHFSPYFKNIIISGTPIRPIPIEPYPNILCIAGKADMNYTDLMALDNKLKEVNYPSKYLTIEYNGKHEWPDASTFYDAFIFLNSMYCYACKINRYETTFLKVNQEKNYTSEYEKMMNYKKIIFMLDSTGAIDDIKKYYNQNITNKDYIAEKTKREEYIYLESKQKKMYLDKLKNEYDTIYWKNEVIKLNDPTDKNSDELAMSKRLLGFLSLASYSFSNRMLTSDKLDLADMMLHFYKIVDPSNPDVAYLSAIYYIKKNDPTACISSLKECIKLGYTNIDKLKNEENFRGIKESEEFINIFSKK
jgi:hypothetical protein